MTLRAMHLGVPAEYDMACQLVKTARNTDQRLLQVFLEAVCSDVNVVAAISQLQPTWPMTGCFSVCRQVRGMLVMIMCNARETT